MPVKAALDRASAVRASERLPKRRRISGSPAPPQHSQHPASGKQGTDRVALQSGFRLSLLSVPQDPTSRDSAGQGAAVAQKQASTPGFPPEPQPSEPPQGTAYGGTGTTQGERLTAPAPAAQAFRFTIMAGCVLTMVSSIRSFTVDRSALPSFFSPQSKRKRREVVTRQTRILLTQLQLPLEPLRRYTVFLPVITSQVLFP